MSHPTLAVGTRVKSSYRMEHVGTLLADDDPRGWTAPIAQIFAVPTAGKKAACEGVQS